jgi:hypothetical protein
MIGIEVDAKQLKRLREAVGKARKSLPRELAAAVNSVSKKTRISIGREIRKTVNLKKDQAEKPIKITQTATAETPTAKVSLAKEVRLGLQHFGARHDNRGVSYKIQKQGGRKRVNGAFMGPRPGTLAPKLHGGVWKREGDARKMKKGRRQGKIAEPIVNLKGVSPYGAYAKNDLSEAEVKTINANLSKEMERRINLNILRANGLVKK